MNLSLDQSLPPSSVPKTSGGFLSRYPTNPSKLKTLREPVDVRKTVNGASTKLVVDLERAKSPTALERRIALDKAMNAESPYPYPAFNPEQSQTVRNTKSLTKAPGLQKNSLVGGLGNQLLTNRSLEALAKVVTKRDSQETQTDPELLKIDFPDISSYQKWSKEVVDPLMRDLRKGILSNRPEEVGMYLEAVGKAMCEKKEWPECKLAEEMWVNTPPETVVEGVEINHSVKTHNITKK